MWNFPSLHVMMEWYTSQNAAWKNSTVDTGKIKSFYWHNFYLSVHPIKFYNMDHMVSPALLYASKIVGWNEMSVWGVSIRLFQICFETVEIIV